MKRQAALPWDKVQSLIDWASDPTDAGESRRAVLKHGTPEMKMEILREQLGVEFADSKRCTPSSRRSSTKARSPGGGGKRHSERITLRLTSASVAGP